MAACLLATNARAEAPLTLDWTAPAGCPDAAWVEASVLRLLSTPPTEPLRVRAVVRPDAAGWQVDLRLEGAARGTRRLRAASCESVARASALIVALALDPQAAALASDEMARGEAAPAPVAAVPLPTPAPATVPPVVPAPARPSRVPPRTEARVRELRGHGIAAAAVELGYVPGLAPAALVGGGLGTRLWRADILLQIAPFSSGSVEGSPAYGADFSLLSAEARGCVGPSWRWVSVEGCGALRATRVNGRGTGMDESYRDHASLLSLGAGVLVRVPSRSRVAAEAGVDATVPMTRPSFVVLEDERERTIHRISAVSARATLGVSIRF